MNARDRSLRILDANGIVAAPKDMAVVPLDLAIQVVEALLTDRQALVRYVRAERALQKYRLRLDKNTSEEKPMLTMESEILVRLEDEWLETHQALSQELKDMIWKN
ncbi:hypothetical protein LCGC14_0660130 [marine sediment metagenome]|uniref:Uncharacterized protein n=1 Tax=marine sediment metagenome TaxID=412755 RepID=A0A0F9QTP9_9ZZZZ